MKIRGSFIITLIVAFSMIFAACSNDSKGSSSPIPSPDQSSSPAPSDKGSDKKTEQVLNLSAGQEITTLDSTGLIDNPTIGLLNNVMEGLYRLGKDNKPIPGIAKSHELSSDGKTYTFELREDAKWSDGSPVTANDFEFAWKKALSAETMSPFSFFFDDIVNGREIRAKKAEVSTLGIKVLSDHKLEVVLSKPVPYFLDLLTTPVFYPQNKAFVEKQGSKYGLEANTVLFSGPFLIESWKHEEGWVLKKNPNYWGTKDVQLETINFKVVKDVGTRMNLYEAGQIDVTALSSEYVEQYKNSKEYITNLDPGMRYIDFNHTNKYLKNKNIRLALVSAWNKQDMVNIVLNDGSIPANYVVPKGFVFGPDGKDFRDKYDGFNKVTLDQAKELWAKGLEELGEKAISLELLNYEGDLSKTIGQYIKNQLEKNLPGLTVTINQQPQKQKLALMDNLKYEFVSSGWGPDYPDPLTFLENYTSDSPYNWSGYNNPKYDELINKAKNNTDLAERWKDLQEAERLLFEEDVVLMPMYQEGRALLIKEKLKGYVTHPFGVYVSYMWAHIE